MNRDEGARFRIAVSDADPLVVPPTLWVGAASLITPDCLAVVPDAYAPLREMPHEAFLRHLLRVDPADPESLIDATVTLGVITPPMEVFVTLTNHPSLDLTHFRPKVKEWEQAQEAGLSAIIAARFDNPYVTPIALDRVAFEVRLLQSLVRYWLAATEGGDVSAAWDGWGLRPPVPEDLPHALFMLGLNLHLRPFAPRVGVGGLDPELRVVVQTSDQPEPSTVLALQLYNAVVEALPRRICPECGTTFIRQDGRAVAGQHRTKTVTYCSSRCARLKADRDYKARQRAKKGSAR